MIKIELTEERANVVVCILGEAWMHAIGMPDGKEIRDAFLSVSCQVTAQMVVDTADAHAVLKEILDARA